MKILSSLSEPHTFTGWRETQEADCICSSQSLLCGKTIWTILQECDDLILFKSRTAKWIEVVHEHWALQSKVPSPIANNILTGSTLTRKFLIKQIKDNED